MQSVRDLQSVVKTMKGLAAVNIRQFERATRTLRDYDKTIEQGLQILLQRHPEVASSPLTEAEGPLAVIVLGSDQGMCGQFNTRIVNDLQKNLSTNDVARDPVHLLAVGTRVGAELDTQGWPVTELLQLPGSASDIRRRVHDLLYRIQQWRGQGVGRVWLLYHRPLSGASYRPHLARLLPLRTTWLQSLLQRTWSTRQLPMCTQHWRELLGTLVRQYLFVALYRGLAESMAAENAARLASMQAAASNRFVNRRALQSRR